jgi:hypothetical protein
MSLLAFFEQLAESPWSVGIHESEIAYSVIESLHVWSMCLFFGLTVIFDLRLLGWTMRKVPVSAISGALLFLRNTGSVLSEYLLPIQSDLDAAGGFERVDFSLARLS